MCVFVVCAFEGVRDVGTSHGFGFPVSGAAFVSAAAAELGCGLGLDQV